MPQAFADEFKSFPISGQLGESLERARRFAREQSHRLVTLEHLLLALTEDSEATVMLEAANIDLARLRADVSAYLGGLLEDMRAQGEATLAPDADLLRVLKAATTAAQQSRRRQIDGAIVLAAAVGDGKSAAAGLLTALGLTFDGAIRALQRSAQARFKPSTTTSPPVRAATPAAGQAPGTPPGPEFSLAASAEEFLAAARARIQQRAAAARGESRAATAAPTVAEGAASPAEGAGKRNDLNPRSLAAAIKDVAEPQVGAQPAAGPSAPAAAPAMGAAAPGVAAEARAQHAAEARAQHAAEARAQHAAAPRTQQAAEHVTEPRNPNAAEPRAPAVAPPLSPNSAELRGPVAAPPTPDMAEPRPPGARVPHAPSRDPRAPAPVEPRPPGPLEPRTSSLPNPRGPAPTDPRVPGPDPQAALRVQHATANPAPLPPRPVLPPGAGAHRPPPGVAPPMRGRAGRGANGAVGPASSPVAPAHPGQTDAAGATVVPLPPRGPSAAPERGPLAESVPRRMRNGIAATAEVRIARDKVDGLMLALAPRGVRPEAFPTRTLAVRLRAPNGGFAIEAHAPETQWLDRSGTTPNDGFAAWRWTITPQRPGRNRLLLTVSARLVGPDGLVAEAAPSDRSIEVRIAPNYRHLGKRWVGWLAVAIAAAAAVQFSGELWAAALSLIKELAG